MEVTTEKTFYALEQRKMLSVCGLDCGGSEVRGL